MWGGKQSNYVTKSWVQSITGESTERGTGRGLLSALLSSEEQKEPHMTIQIVCIFILHLQGRKVY
jgi:hypothetical protein